MKESIHLTHVMNIFDGKEFKEIYIKGDEASAEAIGVLIKKGIEAQKTLCALKKYYNIDNEKEVSHE